MESIIQVSLQDGPPDLTPEAKVKAEQRFAKELARSFRNEDDLRQAYKLFADASEGGVISKADEKHAKAWAAAFDKAKQAGFRDIAAEEAYFEARIA